MSDKSKKTAGLILLLILILILCVSCAELDNAENITWTHPPHFSFNGENYYLYTKKENGSFVDVELDELPEGFEKRGVIGADNIPEDVENVNETGVAGLEYYVNSDDLSIIYLYTKTRQTSDDHSTEEYVYKYIPYAPLYKSDR